MTPVSSIVNTGTGCPSSVVCLCIMDTVPGNPTQGFVHHVWNFLQLQGISCVWSVDSAMYRQKITQTSCAKYLSFDDKREIHLRKLYTTLWLRPFSSRKQIATSFKESLLSCTYIVKIQRSHVSGCLVTVLRMSWPGHVSRVTCCPVWRARCWRGGRWRRTEASPLQHRITATSG